MKITEAKVTFTVDIASYCMDDVVKKGKLMEYLEDAIRSNSAREYDFVYSNLELIIDGEIQV